MSDPVRIALIAEGWTDRSVIEAGVNALLGERPHILTMLQPEDPKETDPFGEIRETGWSGVYRWCREMVDRSQRLSEDVILVTHDLVILHLDADVAHASYSDGNIHDAPNMNDLPCATGSCPPPTATTDALRAVLLRWAGESITPKRVVLCTPSQCIEAWALAALHPNDAAVTKGGLECMPNLLELLQKKPAKERLVRSKIRRINGASRRVLRKDRQKYEERMGEIADAWPKVRNVCTEADRFSRDLLKAVS